MRQRKTKQQSYSDQVIALIKNRIRCGKLRSGDPISELGISQECGISRSPVREALAQLEHDGFIMMHPSLGRCVTVLTPDDIRNRYEVVGMLEGAASASAAEIARKEGDDWSDLNDILKKLQSPSRKDVPFEMRADLGTEFHRLILARAYNPLIADLSNRYCRVVTKYLMFPQWRTLYTEEELFDRHNLIYGLLLRGTFREIEEGVRAHYAESAARLVQLCPKPAAVQPLRKAREVHIPEI